MRKYKYRIVSKNHTETRHGWNKKMGEIGDIIESTTLLIEDNQILSYKGFIYRRADLELLKEFSLKDIYE